MFFEAAGAVMRAAWQALITIQFPGTGIPIAIILIGAFLVVFSLRIISVMMGYIRFGSARSGIGRVNNKISGGRKRGDN